MLGKIFGGFGGGSGKRSPVDRTVGRLKGSKRSTEQRLPAAAPVPLRGLGGNQSDFLSKPTSGILMTLRSESTHGRRVCRPERKGGVGGGRASLPAVGTAQSGRAVACHSRGARGSLCTGSQASKEAGRPETEGVLPLSPHLNCAVSGFPTPQLSDGGFFLPKVRMLTRPIPPALAWD